MTTPEDQRVYVASRASVLARGEMWRRLRSEGAPIISTWIDEDGPNDTADLDELWVRIRREVTTATRLILYVEPDDFPLKGAFVEIGMALAANVPITIVAPGVEIKDRNCRPFGSWIKHPLVNFSPAVADALAHALSASLPQARAVGDEEVERAVEAYEKGLRLVVSDEPVTLAECPVGLFLNSYGNVCLKSEYGSNEGRIDAYTVDSGEMFWGTAPQTIASQRAQLVRPITLSPTNREGG